MWPGIIGWLAWRRARASLRRWHEPRQPTHRSKGHVLLQFPHIPSRRSGRCCIAYLASDIQVSQRWSLITMCMPIKQCLSTISGIIYTFSQLSQNLYTLGHCQWRTDLRSRNKTNQNVILDLVATWFPAKLDLFLLYFARYTSQQRPSMAASKRRCTNIWSSLYLRILLPSATFTL